jgi:hypothetical protein
MAEHPLGPPCDRFTLDYYTDPTRARRPEHRYCVCGWTEAHHEAKARQPATT